MYKLLLSILFLSTLSFAMSVDDIVKKVDQRDDGDHIISQMTMILIDKQKNQRIRSLKRFTKDFGKDIHQSIYFLSPNDIKNTAFLTFDYDDNKKDDDQWLYLPALKRIKRIASRNKSGSFMGSEFSYEDIGNQNYQKFIFSNDAKEVILDGQECYESTRIPKNKNSGYTKQITWIDKKEFLIRKIDYYDRKKELLKTATFSKYKKINTIWRVGQIEMKNFQNDKSTILMWEKEKLHAGLKDKDFNKRVLKK